jgi:hypothetical protein
MSIGLWEHFFVAHVPRLWQHAVMSKDSMIKLRISQAEKDAWEASAKREGMTLSQYVRWIVGPVVGTGKT